MPGAVRAAMLALVVSAVSAERSGAWMRELVGSRSSSDTLGAAAATPAGDLVTLGCPSGLMLFDGATGRPRWQRGALVTSAVCRPVRRGASLVVAPDDTIVIGGGGGVTANDGLSGDLLWSHEVAGSSSDDPALVKMVAIASKGDVVAAGRLDQGGDEDTTDLDFLVERLDRIDGHVVWRVLLDGSPRSLPDDCDDGCESPGHPADQANAVTVRDGLVVAAGTIERGDAPHFAVVAFDDTTGTEAWRWESAAPGEAFAVAADASGLVAAGRIAGNPAVIAFTADGTVRWQASVPGGDGDAWHTLAIGASGDAVVSGRVANHAAVAGYAPSGALVWRHDEPDPGESIALARSASGIVALFALDPITPGSLGRWRVRALDPASGTTAWLVDPADGLPAAVASTPRRIFVAGTSETPATFRDATAIALAPDTGRERWRRDMDTPPDSTGRAEAVATSPHGDVVATGYLSNVDSGFDFVVTALAPRTGRLRWRRELDATVDYATYDYGHAVCIDTRGDVVAAGSIAQPFTVVKLDGATGADHWKATSDPIYERGSARALAIDGLGDVVAGGQLNDRFEVRKLDRDTGALRWRRPLHTETYGAAADVAVVGGDDVIAVGFTPDALYRPLATVVRLASASGEVAWEQRGLGEGGLASVVVHDGVLAVGGHVKTGLDRRSGIVASLDAATGAERWRALVGQGTSWQAVTTVLADARGDVIACAEVSGGSAIVSKLDHATGTTRWQQRVPTAWLFWSPSVTCALDPDDNVVVGTPIETSDGGTQLGVALLDGTSGTLRWERHLRDALNPWSITTDTAGNLFIATERNYPGGFAVVGLGPGPRSARPRRLPK